MILVLVRALALACRGHHELVLENLALRQQLNALRRSGTRPQLGRRDRLFWIGLAQTWRHWRAALVLVQPDTVVRWHREWLRRRWTRRSARSRSGRPTTETAIRTRVSQMAAANPLWGAPRIHGELGTVGVEVSERTVSRLLRRPRRPPSQTWRTFLTNHVATRVSIDFLTVPALTSRVLFVFVVLEESPPTDRSRLRHGASDSGLDGAADATISPMITARARISRLRKTRPRHDGCRPSKKVTWSRSRKSADYTIATNDAQPDVRCRPNAWRWTCRPVLAKAPARVSAR